MTKKTIRKKTTVRRSKPSGGPSHSSFNQQNRRGGGMHGHGHHGGGHYSNMSGGAALFLFIAVAAIFIYAALNGDWETTSGDGQYYEETVTIEYEYVDDNSNIVERNQNHDGVQRDQGGMPLPDQSRPQKLDEYGMPLPQ